MMAIGAHTRESIGALGGREVFAIRMLPRVAISDAGLGKPVGEAIDAVEHAVALGTARTRSCRYTLKSIVLPGAVC